MIIEGILTTETELGEMHIAPIGPHVDRELQKWTLKPFQTSTTFRNLKRSGRCVFHVIDDGLLLVQSILGMCNTKECMPKARYENGFGWVLSDSCRVFPLIVNKWDVSSERAIAECGKVTTLELRQIGRAHV